MSVNAPAGAYAAQLAARKWDGPTRPVSTTITPTNGSQFRVMQNNPRRLHWMLWNFGPNDVWVDFVQPVFSLQGFLLDNGGGWISQSLDEDGESVAWDLYGVCLALQVGGANMKLLEIIRL